MRKPTRRLTLVSLLRQRVTGRLHLGLLRPGDRLPSVRIAAREFEVDPRLVLGAYRHLESEGLVELRARSGVFVATNPGHETSSPNAGAMLPERRTGWLIDRFAESLALGIPAPMFVEHVRRSLESRRLRAVVLDCNADQLWSTADELRRDYGFEVEVVDLDHLGPRVAVPAVVRRADLLVTASPHERTRTIAAEAEVPLLDVTMCPDLFAEVRRLLRIEPVYFVVADARFAAKLDAFLAPSRGKSRLRTLVYPRDPLHEIPSAAPVYLTRLARELMHRDQQARSTSAGSGASAASANSMRAPTEERLINRVMPDARVFSEESARELISFVVRANMAVQARESAGEIPLPLPPSVRRGRVG